MSRILVSVRDVAEALAAFAAGTDLIDVKEPLNGALGAASLPIIEAIVAALPPSAATSAVAGDHDDADALVAAARAVAETGVSFTKVGLGAALARPSAITRIGRELAGLGRLIAVLFADEKPDVGLAPHLARAGFAGAMIDTRSKAGGRLTELIAPAELAAFVSGCRAEGLLAGLAGSLRVEDIPGLARLKPNILGFRGGLCAGGDRRAPLDPARVRRAVETLRRLARGEAA
jgi:(5-formylfuran-3-yl)methyl phosphate synthase